jgi:hypothetical protein
MANAKKVEARDHRWRSSFTRSRQASSFGLCDRVVAAIDEMTAEAVLAAR